MTTPPTTDPNLIQIQPNTEETLLSDLYNEDSGPRKGIFLDFTKAQQLMTFHLQKTLDQLFYFKRGYNNRVYLARCTDGTEYVVRIGGRFWNHTKITNEVQALQLARRALGEDNVVQVPRIVGTSIEEAKVHKKEGERIIPYDYIIMSRLQGVPMDTVWDDFTQEQKKKVVEQVADIFSALRSIEVSNVGNFVDKLEEGGQPVIGALMEGGGGPFLTWGDFVASNIRQEIKNLQKLETHFPECMALLPRLNQLADKVQSGELEHKFVSANTSSTTTTTTTTSTLTAERPISFLHGDFESRNMLVVGTQIVGFHDFEFSGGFPSETEWCAGFEWIFARAEDPYDASEQQKLADMASDEKEILAHFLTTLKERHGLVQYGKENQEYKVILYHLQVNIAPWWLRDIERSSWTEQQLAGMLTVKKSLEKALAYLGC